MLFTVAFAGPAQDNNKKSLTVRSISSDVKTFTSTHTTTIQGSRYSSSGTHDIVNTSTDYIVTNVVEAEGMRYTIVCNTPRSLICHVLPQGDLYPAEIENKTMWVTVIRPVKHKSEWEKKEARMKTTIVDISPAPKNINPAPKN
jgi:hypothetical protein